jgi:hypothetical protein
MAIYDTILFCSCSRARLQSAIQKNSLARFAPSLSLLLHWLVPENVLSIHKKNVLSLMNFFSEEKTYKLTCYVAGHLNQPGRLPLMDSQWEQQRFIDQIRQSPSANLPVQVQLGKCRTADAASSRKLFSFYMACSTPEFVGFCKKMFILLYKLCYLPWERSRWQVADFLKWQRRNTSVVS